MKPTHTAWFDSLVVVAAQASAIPIVVLYGYDWGSCGPYGDFKRSIGIAWLLFTAATVGWLLARIWARALR